MTKEVIFCKYYGSNNIQWKSQLTFKVWDLIMIVSNFIRNRPKLLQVVLDSRISSQWWKTILPTIVVVLPVKVINESSLDASNSKGQKDNKGCGWSLKRTWLIISLLYFLTLLHNLYHLLCKERLLRKE